MRVAVLARCRTDRLLTGPPEPKVALEIRLLTLGAILMGTEMLDMHIENDAVAGSVISRIESSANRMSRMVDQLLDVTRARLGGGIPVTPRPMHLVPLVKSVVDELALANTLVDSRVAGQTDEPARKPAAKKSLFAWRS